MYSLILTPFLLTAFAIILVDTNNYLLLKLWCHKEYKLRTHRNLNYPFITNFKPKCLIYPGFVKFQIRMETEKQKKSTDRRISEINIQKQKMKDELVPRKEFKEPLKPDEIDFVRYHSLDKMYQYLNSLGWKYRHLVNIETLGSSFEERDIKLIRVSTGEVGTKTTILIVGGMNGNEWISPATVIYCIQQLVENPVNRNMLGKTDWYFVPVTNPDGYEYSYQKNYNWKKTRSNGTSNCIGVDLNKNLDYGCNFSLNNDSCSDLYAGTESFSEQEAKALLDLITEGVQIHLFVNINNYGQSLEFPLDNAKKFIQDSSDLQYLAEKVSYAVYKYRGRKYAINGFNSCGSEHWIRREGVKYSYNLKLPLENQDLKLQVSEMNILSIAQEVFVAFREFQRVLETIYSVTYDLISED